MKAKENIYSISDPRYPSGFVSIPSKLILEVDFEVDFDERISKIEKSLEEIIRAVNQYLKKDK